jgi:hypothetical protein
VKTKQNKFNCDTNGSIMVMAALRYALGRHSYVPGAVIDWISLYWDTLDSNTKTVVVRDVFEYLYDEYRKDVDENSPFDSPFGDYDIKTWNKFGIDKYWKLEYTERKSIDEELNSNKDRAAWFSEILSSTKLKNVPNWKKGDIIALTNNDGGVISIVEAEHDPQYCNTILCSKEDWYYGLRNCEEIRLATVEDIDHKIKYQTENVEREKAVLDQLLNFRERLSK